MNETIIYPSVDLFVYDLKDGLGEDKNKINKNLRDFCRKIYGDLKPDDFPKKVEQITNYINSQTGESIYLLETRTRKFSPPDDGYYYPIQFDDTYALFVTSSGKFDAQGREDDNGKSLDSLPFAQLKQEINQRISQNSQKIESGTIGQTWLVWGKLTDDKTDIEVEQFAQKCYTQIIDKYDWKRDFIGKGKLLTGTVFELWYCPHDSSGSSPELWEKFRAESHHILIWMFPESISPDEMKQQVNSMYHDFLRLWQYRHKIVWSYYQSRYQKSKLKKEYVEIQPAIRKASELPKLMKNNQLNLNNLQSILSDNLINLSDYTIALNSLENHHQAIKINLDNYRSRLAEIEKQHPGSDLEFLKIFCDSDVYAQKYQQQITADIAIFTPGLTLLQNLNNTIEGVITLEQTKSDRQLNNTIAVVGVGLATSQVASAVILAQPNDYKQHLGFRAEVFLWSFLIGAIAIFLTLIILRTFRRD